MLSCWNAIRPPMMTARNRPTIRYRRSTAKETRRSIRSGSLHAVLGARRCPVDEQTAPDDDFLPRLEVAADLDQITIGQAGLDLPQFERLVVMRHPEPHALALIDQRLLLHPDRLAFVAGIDRDIGEHLRLE